MSRNEENRRDEELNRRLERLAENTETSYETESGLTTPGLKQAAQGLKWFGGAVAGAVHLGSAVYDTAIAPVWNTVKPVFNFMASGYMKYLWNPLAYTTNEIGERVFSKKGAAAAVAITCGIALALPTAVNVTKDFSAMAMTTRTTISYLHTPNSHNDGTYSVKGCDTLNECDQNEVVYYNIEPSIARHIWSLFNKGSLYTPTRLVGTISPDSNNRCEVTVYGAFGENMERTMQQFRVYPELLDVSCERVDDQGNPVTVELQQSGAETVAPQVQQIVPGPAPS